MKFIRLYFWDSWIIDKTVYHMVFVEDEDKNIKLKLYWNTRKKCK